MFDEGDKVLHIPTGRTGYVKDIDSDADTGHILAYFIDFNNNVKEWCEPEDLEMHLPPGYYGGIQAWEAPKCHCGVDTLGEGRHSDYCPKYKPYPK